MSRVALTKTLLITLAVVVVGAGGGTWAAIANSPSHKVATVVNAQHQITQMSYQGQAGQTALTLLKKHATVQVKHYSFGDQVIAINGTSGNGPKYWTFYINSKEASVGAGTYVTKSTDKIMWKLQ